MNTRKVVSALLLLAVCALTAGSIYTQVTASPVVMAVKQLKWRDTIGQSVASLPADTTFLTDENDTTLTYAIDTADWDWNSINVGTNGTSAGGAGARVIFVATGADNQATDTLNFQVQKGVGQNSGAGAGADTVYTANGTIIAATGSIALPEGAAGGRIYTGMLIVDPDTPSAANVYMVPSFRLRVCGDVSGTTPKLAGLKCFIVYPKRAEAQ